MHPNLVPYADVVTIKMKIIEAKVGENNTSKTPGEKMGKKIAEKSMTLLNNFNEVIPVNKEKIKKVLLITPAKDETSCEKLLYLKTVFESYGIEVILRKDLWIPELKELEQKVDLTVGCSHFLGLEYERQVRDWYFLCNAGFYTASIMSNGDIVACLDIERRPEVIQGNVLKDDFKKV